MKVLVTGATGFLGAHVARHLLQAGHQVRILRRENSSTTDIADLTLETIIGDLCDPMAMLREAVNGVDAIIHAAAKISYDPRDEDEMRQINYMATLRLLSLAKELKLKRFVFVSSILALGTPDPGTVADEMSLTTLANLCSYAEQKMAAEELVRYAVEDGLSAVIVNPGAIFGPGDRRRLRGNIFTQGLAGYFYIDGGIATVDVEDVADGIVRALDRGREGENYILCGENHRYYDMRCMAAEAMKRPHPRFKIPTSLLPRLAQIETRLAHWQGRRPTITEQMLCFLPHTLYFSSQKAQRELGVQFRPFHETVNRAVRWYRDQGLL